MFKYLKRILSYYWNYKGRIIIVFLCSLIIMAASYNIPIITTKIIDNGFMNKDFRKIATLGAVLFGLYILNSVVEVVLETNRIVMFDKLRFQLRKESFEHLMSVKLDFFNTRNSAAIKDIIVQDVDAVCTFLSPEAFMVITGLFSSGSAAVALCSIHLKLGLCILAFIPINLILSVVMTKINQKNVIKYMDQSDNYNNWFGDAVNGVKEIRLFGIQKYKRSELQKKQGDLLELDVKRSFISKLSEQLEICTFNLLSVGIYIAGGYIMVKGGLTVGEVIAFESFAVMVSSPITFCVRIIAQVFMIAPYIKRHFKFMDYENESNGEIVAISDGDIEFRNISFAYDPKIPLINNLSLTIKHGRKVALLGKNGVGKTTSLNIIMRFLTPNSGSIYLNGHDISEYEITSYRNLFSVVSQEVFLFNDTIKNNICLYTDFDNERFDSIINLVNLRELVEERGLDYIVGINGSKLSGGQKQKIALARALLHDRSIVVLDEATSNLDLDTIEIIKGLFENEFKERTVICVTHSKEFSELFDEHINL